MSFANHLAIYFEIQEELGRGGMGIVYKAQQKLPQRTVALKILNAQQISTRQKRRFLKEMQIAAKLNHPQIVKVYSAQIEAQTPYIAMQYIDGVSLDCYLQQNKFVFGKILQLMISIAKALHYTHQQNVIHRDLKPGNILVDNQGTPYLSDFGLARSTRLEDRSLTRTGEILGTISYMAPEQAQGLIRDIDHRADIYALGAIMYEICTGRAPVRGDNSIEKLYNLISEIPPTPRQINPQIPLQFEAVVMKAMAYRKHKRYQSAEALAEDLECLLEQKPIQARRQSPLLRKSLHFVDIHRTLLVSIAAATIIFLCGLLWWATQKSTDVGGAPQRHIGQISISKLQNIILQLEKQNDIDSMRLVLSKLYDRNPDLVYLQFIGKTAMNWGYFQDAGRYFDAALQKAQQTKVPGQIFHQKYNKARALLYSGKIYAARDIYNDLLAQRSKLENQHSKLPNHELLVDLATLSFAQQHYEQVTSYLQKAKLEKLSTLSRVRKLLLTTHIIWEQQAKILTRWQWLNADNDSLHGQMADLRTRIAAKINQAQQLLSSCKQNHLSNSLSQLAKLYQQALNIEFNTFDTAQCRENLQRLQASMCYAEISLPLEAFFTEIMVRCLIRHREWKQACSLSNTGIANFPACSRLYLLRAIVHFRLRNLRSGCDDTLQVINLERFNFVPIENMTEFLTTNITQEEFYEFVLTISSFFYNASFDFEQLIFDVYRKQLANHYETRKQTTATWQSATPNIKLLLKTILADNSGAHTLKLAMNILASQYQSLELQHQLQLLSLQQSLGTRARHNLRLLNDKMQQFKQQIQIDKLRRILLRYSVFQDIRYVIQVRQMAQHRSLLKTILHNEQEWPMMRLLATQMLMAMRTQLQYLRDLAQSNDYPENLLAAVIIRKAGIMKPLPSISAPQIIMPDADADIKTSRQQYFYHLLLALYIHPRMDSQLYQKFALKLVTSNHKLLSLCAIYNLRRYKSLNPRLSFKKLERFLLQHCRFPRYIY